MKKIKKLLKANFIYIVPIVLSLIMLSAFLTLNFSYAKYVSASSINSGARVARVAVDIVAKGSNAGEVTYKAGAYEYYFTVTNQKDGALSEVEVEYTLSIDDKECSFIDDSYSLYRIAPNGLRTKVELINKTAAKSEALGILTRGGAPSMGYDEHNYVLVYYPYSVTSTSETLFSINIIATQKN